MVTTHCLHLGRSGLDLCHGVWLGSNCSCHSAYLYAMSLIGTTYRMHLVGLNGWWGAESNASFTVYYPDQQMHNILILIIFYVL